jgi:hypothetical protein
MIKIILVFCTYSRREAGERRLDLARPSHRAVAGSQLTAYVAHGELRAMGQKEDSPYTVYIVFSFLNILHKIEVKFQAYICFCLFLPQHINIPPTHGAHFRHVPSLLSI